jgi:Mg2+/Co2+ transporter CorB
MIFAQTPTAIDYWMLAGIGLILVALIFLSLAEMSLSQLTKPRAAALAEKGAKSGKALVRLAAEPTMWVNPLLLTVNVCQTVQATLMGIVAGRLFGPAGVAVGAFTSSVCPLSSTAFDVLGPHAPMTVTF